jgi:hypothetical protein
MEYKSFWSSFKGAVFSMVNSLFCFLFVLVRKIQYFVGVGGIKSRMSYKAVECLSILTGIYVRSPALRRALAYACFNPFCSSTVARSERLCKTSRFKLGSGFIFCTEHFRSYLDRHSSELYYRTLHG